MLIADFGHTIQTDRGGFYRAWGGKPDQVTDDIVELGEPQHLAWRVELAEQARAEGMGAIIPLFDERSSAADDLLEITSGADICVRILGSLGQRQAKVEIVAGTNPEAAGTTIGTIDAGKLDPRKWSELRFAVPNDFTGAERAGFVRIFVEGSGTAWVALESLAISSEATEPSTSKSTESKTLRKALWFWETDIVLPDRRRTYLLLELCRTQGITDLYCQIHYDYEDGEIEMRFADEHRAFNASAESLGITIHALDGAPSYVFRENHQRMLDLVDTLAKFNEDGSPNERFQAVHLDNEPYVLPGWHDDDERRIIIRDYIELNQKLRRKTKEVGVELGVDIPFWWDELDADGNAKFTYDTETGKQPILEALFPLMDNVGIMSYRVRVTGLNGLVFTCLREFELGEKHEVDVFTSMELGTGDDVDKGTTMGIYPWSYFHRQISTLKTVLTHTPGCAGYAIHYAEPFAEAVHAK